jgi:hypothetical protein
MLVTPKRCPFLALYKPQGAAKRGSRPHGAKVGNRQLSRTIALDPATSSTRLQRPASVSFSAC